MNTAILIVVSGLPGTGKTTFAQALARELGIAHLNSDMLREELGKRGRYDTQTKELIYRQLEERTAGHLLKGEHVIVDATFYKQKLRLPYIALAGRFHTPLKWIEMTASETAVKNRVSQKRAYSEADFEVYEKIKNSYEPLSIDHLVLPSDELSMPDMLNKAKGYLQAEA